MLLQSFSTLGTDMTHQIFKPPPHFTYLDFKHTYSVHISSSHWNTHVKRLNYSSSLQQRLHQLQGVRARGIQIRSPTQERLIS